MDNTQFVDMNLIGQLDAYRVARQVVERTIQTKHDLASLLEIQANKLRAEADVALREINELTTPADV